MDSSRNFSRLRIAAPLFAAIAVVALLYAPSIATLWEKWVLWDQDLAHALPTIGVMLVLLARRTYHQTEGRETTNYLYWLFILALTFCSLCWYFFESLSISLPAYIMLIAILCLFISTCFSISVMWAVLPYLGLLIFTIPIWSELTTALVKLSSITVGQAVKWSQITVLLDGNSLFLPSGTIYIADGCSGIRYLIIALLMGYILILLNQYKLTAAIATIIIAIALGLLANWLRIYLLVLIGYHSEMQSSLMRDHETFGWAVFACILVPAIYFSPVSKKRDLIINLPKYPRLLPLLPLLTGPVLLYFSTNNISSTNPLNLDHLNPYQITNNARIGTSIQPGILQKEKKVIGVDNVQIRVDLFTNTPTESREEIVPFIGELTEGTTWQRERSTEVENFTVDIYKKVGGQEQIIIAKQYLVGTMQTHNYWTAKLIQIIAKVSNNSYFGLLTVQTNCKDDCTEEMAQLTTALPTISPTH